MLDKKITQHAKISLPVRIAALTGIQRGIEKEGLRVRADGGISQSPHPKKLGSTLTHPSITTDYSEALLEFITPVQDRAADSVTFLRELHSFALRYIDDELIWPASMPCRLRGDSSIPIAQYGSSNIGTMKHVYRRGLGVRYGRIMQSIAGIHYNFSLSQEFWTEYQVLLGASGSLQDFISEQYFTLIRNFRRNSWLLHYLFGASPVLDKSFVDGNPHELQQMQPNTFGLEFATSLRMSDLGYQNSAQDGLQVSYNSLDDYVTTLGQAVGVPNERYEKLGVKRGGHYQQLNTNVLQLENEYYSDIRPKRVTRSGEKPIAALRSRGVEYIEVRILDINPLLEVGIDETQMNFLDTFLLYCLASGCPGQTSEDCEEIRLNQQDVINRGRDPDLRLRRNGKLVPFKQKASNILDCIADTATLLDQAVGGGGKAYTRSVDAQRIKVNDVEQTPSARVMREVKAGQEFLDITLAQAIAHKETLLAMPLSEQRLEELEAIAVRSLQDQRQLEQLDTLDFDQFLRNYNHS